MNQQFKLGDKVRIVNEQGFFTMNIGRVGKIVEIDNTRLPVKVEFDDYGEDIDSFDYGKYEGIELVEAEALADTAPVVELVVGDRVICVNQEELPDDFGKKGTVVEKSSFGGSRTVSVRFDGEHHSKLYLRRSFNKIDEELADENSVVDNPEVTVGSVVEKPESDRISLLTPAQLRVYNAAVKLSEAQLEFTKAIDAHHAELHGE
ncbi:hypothetical protein PMW_07 [Pseudomonas phage phiPMW]|uniref:Uncharacterized protein n=1 Tax=Pseudomonas phage phiPMW TaxID=1815582 RepID=A0A1S5R140_9CAUD|nr:hypothetical protein FDG97_gp007 [Pseudomonas phage phiPMW]ANA49132.1 hypothetical protein PMW_07 [Pseudomonas phage phiPMW]